MTTWISFELNILKAIQYISNPTLDSFFVSISALGNGSIFWIAFILFCLSTKEYKKMGKVMIIAFILNLLLVNILLKNIVGRVRPYNYVNNIKLLVPALSDGSFPSGHASYAFTFATIVAFMARGKMLKIFIAILAILIAFSRLYLFVHFPSDVIVGAVVGILIGTFSMRAYFKGYINQIFNKFNLQRE
ncbi:MAG: phosphatase PAP2 family protein [Anaerococcus sp.]|uniref:Phosphatase PAP2 family protein n=1 Tax=Anaerococcus nagyae TaxID=1755241 RepID=A0A3E2TJC3_9FIRM|nr:MULTISPECIES: phosphatase PAP2 family protein [Anaerococcus]MBP2069285.1 undecaprenyl-diphosphatase [Anaerococcus nagyae]MDU2353540.1 phosphatase PAP2 family protein [Anaerococcus sp.]MDU3211846.1 phosphatase PAP2 family protein [Anaerococcus sp.]RGB77111.1 phosphatase PAP2 family protein [Anaerococcus nagyae]